MHRRPKTVCGIVLLVAMASRAALGADLIPPLAKIKTDRPRVLLRPDATPYAISLAQLKAIPRDADFNQMLAQLKRNSNAAVQAMVWLLTGDTSAAEKAISRLRAYTYPGEVDTFHIYLRLLEFGLAYDWLYNYEGFPKQLKAEVRARILPLAQKGIRVADDHMFHNYVWMSAGGVAIWALATAGEDDPADQLFAEIRQRLNTGLFPAWKYLDGLPSEPMGYWALYVLTPGALALLGAQSASETDVVGAVHKDGDWLNRQLENLIQSTLPDMRYIPWGDLQSGPNGGVTHEMAGIVDALTWALRSPHGAYFSNWLAHSPRGLQRFYGETAIFYMLYTRNLKTRPLPEPPGSASPSPPPLSFLAGNERSGHFIARSGWDAGATIVTLTATDHFGDHHHYDQGSFIIYRNGLLAVDPPVYRQVRGPQQKTEYHNTLLIGGQPQRAVRGQWFKTVEEFQHNLLAGRKLETGDILFYKEGGAWAAAACQFAQAYPAELIRSCVRQLLFVRPDKVVIVDQLVAPAGKDLPEVQWLLQLPSPPALDGGSLWASGGKSWLRCRPILPGGSVPVVTATPVGTQRASYSYRGKPSLTLVHLLEVGDGRQPGKPAKVTASQTRRAVEVTLDGRTFAFAAQPPFEVTVR
jgi:hypothetical protein